MAAQAQIGVSGVWTGTVPPRRRRRTISVGDLARRMEAPTLDRRLVAILAADVEGYSRLMALDEEAALAKLSAHRAIADELIVGFHGVAAAQRARRHRLDRPPLSCGGLDDALLEAAVTGRSGRARRRRALGWRQPSIGASR